MRCINRPKRSSLLRSYRLTVPFAAGMLIWSLIILLPVSAYSDPTEKLLEKSSFLLETGKPDSAAVLLFDVLESIPDDSTNIRVKTLYQLSRSMKMLGRLTDEINYLIMAREEGLEAEYADVVRHAYADLLLDAGNLDGCIGVTTEFREQLTDSPLLPDILYIAGNAYILKKDYLRASNAFFEITRNYPDADAAREAVMKEGVCLYNLDLVSGAIERLELYLFESPRGTNIAEALHYLGKAYEKRNELSRAADTIKRLIIDYPAFGDIIDLHYRLAKLLFRTARYAEAENAFENFLFNADPDDIRIDNARLYIERIQFHYGIYATEADIAENFITKYPESPKTPGLLFDLARYYRTMSNINDAVDTYRILMNNQLYHEYADSAAVSIADVYSENNQSDKATIFLIQTADELAAAERRQRIYLKLGELHYEWGSHDEAIGWFDRALSIAASDTLSYQALFGIGRTFKTLNRWYEAASTFERLVAEYHTFPGFIEVRLALSDVYSLQGLVREAAEQAEYALPLADDDRKPDIVMTLAELYEEIDEEHALKLYSMLYNNDHTTPQKRSKALMEFGDLSLRRGDRTAAIQAFNKIIADPSDSTVVAEARNRIADIDSRQDDSTPDHP